MKVKVGLSAHHVHLTKETYDKLFDDEINKIKDLKQVGEFASDKQVTLKTEKGTIERVRVLGPFRDYDQVEISKTESYVLGLNPPVRASGDIEGSPGVTLVTNKGEVTLEKGVVIAERHLHLNVSDTKGFKDKQKLLIKIDTEKAGIIEVVTKITDKGHFELHLDTDDANAFLLNNNDEVEIIEKV